MRVLLVNKFWRPVGGVEEHCRLVAELLNAHGHEVVRFGVADEANDPPLPETQSVGPVSFRDGTLRERARAGGRAIMGRETRRRIAELLDREAIDVAHVVHAYHQLGMTFLPLLRRRAIPVLLDLHDYKVGCPNYRLFDDRAGEVCTTCLDRASGWAWAPTTQACWDGSRLGGLMLSAEAASAKFVKAYVCADRVVVVNTLQRSAALRAGIDESHIHVIPNWAPATGDQVERVPATHVLFAGRLVPEKGVDVLIRAAALSGVSVRIAGDGRLRSSLQRLAREQGADIDFLGWCDREKLSHELRSAAAVVVPSIWPEVFGRVTVEAFRAGVPVIGSAIGGTIDLLADDRGYLYNPFDVNQLAALLSQVVRDPAAAQARAAKARAFAASELNQERWTQRFRLVYEALGRPL